MTVRASDLKRPLASRLREDRERLRVQGSTATLARSGMAVTAEDEVTVDGDFIVDGQLNVTGAAVIGGTLSLPAGIIDNDALAAPVSPGVYHAEAVGFTVSTSLAAKATITVNPPAGYTRAMVSAVASASAYNPTASSDYIYVAAWIQTDSTRGYAIPSSCPANDSGATSQAASALLTGLSGSFTIKAAVSSGFSAYTTNTSGNVCNVDATVLFLR